MPGVILTLGTDQLQYQRLGYCAVSITETDSNLEPKIRAGSKIEIGGALIDFRADENILDWAGIANDSLVYIYVDGFMLVAHFTATPPKWSATKQAWVSTDETKRYLPYGLYKDLSGRPIHKTIALENPCEGVGRLQASVFKNRAGWLLCDGSIIDKSASPHLSNLVNALKLESEGDASHPFYDADANKARLPDGRDRVLKMVGSDGRKSGEYQADAAGPHQHDTNIFHQHSLKIGYGAGTGTAIKKFSEFQGWTGEEWTNDMSPYTPDKTKRSGDPVVGGAEENRVKSIGAYLLIKW